MSLLVGDVVRHGAAVTPNRLAATLGNEEITFSALDDHANRIAHTLAADGVGIGDRVAWQGETSIDALALFFGLAKLGAVFMPVSPRFGTDETAVVLRYARPHRLVDDITPLLASPAPDAHRDRDLPERAPHVIFFTSGSTGRPKGVVLSHRVNCLRSFPSLAAEADGGTVCMFPLFHMAGWSLSLGAWQARRPVHLVAAPDAEALLEVAARRRASRLYAIPAVWARILERGVHKVDLSALREADTGTSATPPELVAGIRDALPHTVTRVFYGSTEAGAGTVLGDADVLRKPGSVGLPQAGVSLRLTDAGEVCLRSELLMDGYFDDPDATAAALDADGWYHSGDLGALDDEGYLSIVGRLRDVIRTGGESVAPSEVEGVLAAHPEVVEVAVVGVPDARWGEVVCAVVVAAGPVELDDLRAFCADRLARFKQPRRLQLVSELPRTAATGQVQRALLVERLATQPPPR
ncbi:MAG: class I adenylate-forming enzyme family protein [Acidimicrobiia bacterium]